MTRVVSTIQIRRDIADVFDFLTTPKNWPEWHPASISVAGSTDHSLTIGEEVTEEFIAAGRRGRTVWRVTAREAPYLWRIESSESEASATITYRLHTEAGMTVFERDMQYHFGPPMISPKAMFLRRRMERESREALFRAKQILDSRLGPRQECRDRGRSRALTRSQVPSFNVKMLDRSFRNPTVAMRELMQ